MRRLKTLTALVVTAASAGLAGCTDDAKSTALKTLFPHMFRPKAPQLVRMVADPDDPDLRRTGVSELARREQGMDASHLKLYSLMARSDEHPTVRSEAVRALGRSGDPDCLPCLLAALKDESPTVRCDAAVALDRVTGPEAVGPLRQRARTDPSADVRRHCARALRHYRRLDVFNTLVDRLGDESFAVRYQARDSLMEMTGQELGFDADRWATVDLAEVVPPGPEPRPAWWDLRARLKRRKKAPARKPAPETTVAATKEPQAAPEPVRPVPMVAPTEEPQAESPVAGPVEPEPPAEKIEKAEASRPAWWDLRARLKRRKKAPARKPAPETTVANEPKAAPTDEAGNKPWWDLVGRLKQARRRKQEADAAAKPKPAKPAETAPPPPDPVVAVPMPAPAVKDARPAPAPAPDVPPARLPARELTPSLAAGETPADKTDTPAAPPPGPKEKLPETGLPVAEAPDPVAAGIDLEEYE